MANLQLASAGDDIKLWDINNGYSLVQQFNPHSHNISSICWSNDNSSLASASTSGDKIVLSYTNAGRFSQDLSEEENIRCIAFNSTSRYIMGGGPDGVIHVWDLKTNKHKKSYKDHKASVTSIRFNWNDTYIASGSEQGEVILNSVVTGQGCSPLVAPKVQAIRQIEYSHFKKSLLGTVSDDGAVNLWDTNARRLLHSFSDMHKAPATGIAFSPLNEMLMMSVGLDKRIICYDVHGKSEVKTLVAESPLTSIDILHDGSTLAVGSTRGKIYIYDLRQGKTPVKTLSAHKSSVQCLQFQNNVTPKSHKAENNTSKTKPANTSTLAPKKSSSTPASSCSVHKRHQLSSSNGLPMAKSSTNMDRVTQETLHESPGILGRSGDTNLQNHYTAELSSDFSGVFSPKRDSPPASTEQTNRKNSGNFDSVDNRGKFVETIVSSGKQSTEGIFSPLAEDNGRHTPAGMGASEPTSPSGTPRGPINAWLEPQLDEEYIGSSKTNNKPAENSFGKGYHMDGNARGNSQMEQRFELYGSNGYEIQKVSTPEDGQPASGFSPVQTHNQSYDRTSATGYNQDQTPLQRERISASGYSPEQTHSQRNSKIPSYEYSPEPTRPKRNTGRQSPVDVYVISPSPDKRKVRHVISRQSPSSEDNSGDKVTQQDDVMGAEGGSHLMNKGVQPFQIELIRNLIQEELEEIRDQNRKDIIHLHFEILKQFQIQQDVIRNLLKHNSINEELIAENQRLREENHRLNKKF